MRIYSDVELRSDATSISGTVVPYTAPATIVRDGALMQERIGKGALNYSGDVLLTVGHSDAKMLARTPTTLVLEEDDNGLHFRAEPPDTREFRDARELIKAGVLRGASAEFHVTAEDIQAGVRHVLAGQLVAVSLVSRPAYPTRVQARKVRRRTWRAF